jgi:ComF family protein
MTLGGLVERALDLAFPGTCVGCGREGEPLCRACEPGLDVRLESQRGVPIGLPGDLPIPLLQLEWCAPFHGLARDALHAIKYGGEQRLARPLGAAVARRWRRAGVGATVVAHVPVHADRAKQRGYDQAALIARSAARDLGLPHADLLVRARATTAQSALDRQDRADNVAGAFALRDYAAGANASWLASTRPWILLLDDVVTTGATLAACAEVLERSGAVGVSAICVAREQ